MTVHNPIGIIGGSGFKEIASLSNRQEVVIETPFGPPSAPIVTGEIAGVPIVFVQRHGPGHVTLPSEINARANIAALKIMGARNVLSFSAVGSLTEKAPPGTFVIVNQFLDQTYLRKKTFFGDGIVAHVPFGDPICSELAKMVASCAAEAGVPALAEGTYVVMEGPQFSTRAESEFHRSLGGTVIGMTAMPEPKLCREAEMCYSMIAMVTDFDCWHDDHDDVTADAVSAAMVANREKAERLLTGIVSHIGSGGLNACVNGCCTALDGAIMTDLSLIPQHKRQSLNFLLSRVLEAAS
jgi:5'-methylthioadenosine phosphorylase